MNFELLYSEFPVLKLGNITLKKIEKRDFEDLYLIHSNKDIYKYIPGKPKSNIKTVENMIDHYERDFNKKKMIFLGIYQKNKLVGMSEIFDIDKKADMLTIGYRLNPEFWGQGIATKTTKLLVDYLINEIEVNRIQAFVIPENVKSSKVLERNSFIYEGTLRQSQYWKDIGLVDLKVYSVLKDERSK